MQKPKPYTEWASNEQWSVTAAGERRKLNVYPDIPDYRDYVYTPALVRVRASCEPEDYSKLLVLDQGKEGACTGFGLAATINYLKFSTLDGTPESKDSASPRMLYELARKNDEWPGVKYVGSSCRGAIKGWYSMGVCREQDYPYEVGNPGIVTVERAKEARKTRIGAYYRIKHRLADFHAAINETGAIFVSASVHKGWTVKFSRAKALPIIPKQAVGSGRPGHAFCLVGYNDTGFIVQNSWGKKWGRSGFAIWTYEDWYENIRDAWVFRLSLSTPAIWQVSTRLKTGLPNTAGETKSSKPVRGEIAGHFVHIDDGQFHDHGAYASNLEDVIQTAELLANSPTDKYRHLLFYAHGGLNSPVDSARRIRGMKDVFKQNKIYPYHFMYDTGITEEIKDVIQEKLNRSAERAGKGSDVSDYVIEKLLRGMGRSIWREMKRGAQLPFAEPNAGWQVIAEFLTRLHQTRPDIKIHLVGHSTGGILLAYLLEAMEAQFPNLRVNSLSLLAPAATTDLFYTHYKPLLETPPNLFGIDETTVYNLSDKLERDDRVTSVYRKSLLYLVSRSFEEELGGDKSEDTQKEKRGARILGMQRYSVPVDRRVGSRAGFLYSGTAKAKDRTHSKTHGGFDNDVETMNDILRRVLKRKRLDRPFNQQDLSY